MDALNANAMANKIAALTAERDDAVALLREADHWVTETNSVKRGDFRRRRDQLLARLAPPAEKPEGTE